MRLSLANSQRRLNDFSVLKLVYHDEGVGAPELLALLLADADLVLHLFHLALQCLNLRIRKPGQHP